MTNAIVIAKSAMATASDTRSGKTHGDVDRVNKLTTTRIAAMVNKRPAFREWELLSR
jgi:hypothetical protein